MRKLLCLLLVMGLLALSGTTIAASKTIFTSGNWVVKKNTDEMSDKISYELQSKDWVITIGEFPGVGLFLSVYSECTADIDANHGPFIRIDKNEAFEVYNIRSTSIYPVNHIKNELISQMKKGKNIKVKKQCWIEHDEIFTVSLTGFAKAFTKFDSLGDR